MKVAIGCLIGLVFVVSVSAEPLLEGQVRLESGEPVADAQVRIFDMTDLRQGAIARALTDGTGYFALPLAALGGRALPARFALGPNYPNPFNPSTIIPYQLAASAAVRLEVFNLLGQRIAKLVDGARPAGFHTATWHAMDAAGRAVAAGVYIYRMTVGVERQTGRMVLIDGQAGVSAVGAASAWSGAFNGGGSDGADAQVYGLIVSGSGLVPYVDSSFRVEGGMAPVELVVSSGLHSAGKVTDDDCAFCDLFGTFNDQQEEEEDETPEEEAETDSTSSEGGPDLVVQAPSVSAVMLTPGQEFTLHVTVHNQGDEQAAATTLHYYRSSNTTITSSDTEVGSDAVSSLAASATSAASIALTAPTGGGSGIYYGACVASVSGESDTDNNCSSAVKITVSGQVATEEEEDDGADGQDEDFVFTDPQIYNDNIFILPISEDLAINRAPSPLEMRDYTKRFYQHFEDEFDFLLVLRNLIVGADVIDTACAFYVSVSNNVQGIGEPLYSEAQRWGSSGKLQGVLGFRYVGTSSILRWTPVGRGPGIHEFMHRWANSVAPTRDGFHWGFSSANGILGGFDITSLVDHGGNRYTAGEFNTNGSHGRPFSPIELYLAGLISPEEVPDLWVAEDGEWVLNNEGGIVRASDGYPIFTASQIKTYTIEDIISEHGPRVPDASQSQRDFRAAVILLTDEKHPANRRVLERLSEDVSWTSHAAFTEEGDDRYGNAIRKTNFYESTGGRATITMDDLSHFQSDASAKRVVPRSFGTPPPPIVDIRE